MINLVQDIDDQTATRFIPEKFLEINLQRSVIVDKREFKSLLPSYLYHNGFTVYPMFLDSADYILSNQVAVEKKSVHTRDLHESLRSGRLADQVKKMCFRFQNPYLLIECQ